MVRSVNPGWWGNYNTYIIYTLRFRHTVNYYHATENHMNFWTYIKVYLCIIIYSHEFMYIIYYSWRTQKTIVTSPLTVFHDWSQFSPQFVYVIINNDKNNTVMIEHNTGIARTGFTEIKKHYFTPIRFSRCHRIYTVTIDKTV